MQTVAASLQGRVALGPRAGQVLRRLCSAASAQTTAPRCARLEGFSLHADVAVPARRRDQLGRVCPSLLRPPLALERLTESSGGQLQGSAAGRRSGQHRAVGYAARRFALGIFLRWRDRDRV